MFKVFQVEKDFAAWYKNINQPSNAGARVEFRGVVRDVNDGKEVKELFYEGYESMIIKKGNELLAKVKNKFSLIDLQAGHFLGNRKIGDLAVIIIAFSEHRKECFAATAFLMEEIKNTLPIWKKESYAQVASQMTDQRANQRASKWNYE